MKYLIHITAYDAHYPNANVFHETMTVTSKSMATPGDRQMAESDIRRKRGFLRVVIDSWEEVK